MICHHSKLVRQTSEGTNYIVFKHVDGSGECCTVWAGELLPFAAVRYEPKPEEKGTPWRRLREWARRSGSESSSGASSAPFRS